MMLNEYGQIVQNEWIKSAEIRKEIGTVKQAVIYYDHIIRNELEYQKIWEYINTNPLKWQEDKYFI